jgi:hypothetical protein
MGQYAAHASSWKEPSSYSWGHANRASLVWNLENKDGTQCGIEDPTVWTDKQGVFHAIVHNWHAGGHAASPNGQDWHWYGGNCSNKSPAFQACLKQHGAPANHGATADCIDWSNSPWPRVLNFTSSNGRVLKSQSAPDRERPHLIMGSDGYTPVALSTGYGAGPGDHVYTLVQETDLSAEEMRLLY